MVGERNGQWISPSWDNSGRTLQIITQRLPGNFQKIKQPTKLRKFPNMVMDVVTRTRNPVASWRLVMWREESGFREPVFSVRLKLTKDWPAEEWIWTGVYKKEWYRFKGGTCPERKPHTDSVPDTQEEGRKRPDSVKRRRLEGLSEAFIPWCPGQWREDCELSEGKDKKRILRMTLDQSSGLLPTGRVQRQSGLRKLGGWA